ncbi:MAG: zinc-ribbon domain-containing protein [Ruminococcaceae bacterium]|nr:zinc-ribbon domain-containing protein [Oscillospiraceae bacterium]
MIKCPSCENEISEDSTVCKYCGADVRTGKNHFEKKFKKYCKKCGGGINPDIKVCTRCGKRYFKFHWRSFLIGLTVGLLLWYLFLLFCYLFYHELLIWCAY